MGLPHKILIVDDSPGNIRLMDAVLVPQGYQILAASTGTEALDVVATKGPDLILLDVMMPGLSGFEVCQRLRANPAYQMIPIVMVTASGEQDKVRAIEAGADDFIARPFNQAELLARVRSLLRVKAYHDTIQAQAAELERWNQSLKDRVDQQVQELGKLSRLRRFLSPQVAEAILSSGTEQFLESHRREIAVVFADLRNFTPFAEISDPEEVMEVLGEFDREMGTIIFRFEGTLVRFAGDGVMVLFNDPLPCAEPALRAVCMAVAMRERMADLAIHWRARGHDLGLGIGVALGYATLGKIGFEGRLDYDAIGPVVNMASRLCDEAAPDQILLGPRAFTAVRAQVEAQAVGSVSLKGFHSPIQIHNILSVRESVVLASSPKETGR